MSYPMEMTEYAIDQLAERHATKKEQIRVLRDDLWKIEQEIHNRMITRNATELVGEAVRVRMGSKKTYGLDLGNLELAQAEALNEGVFWEFQEAFPLSYEVKRQKMKDLLRRGGKLAELIEQAVYIESEKPDYTFKSL